MSDLFAKAITNSIQDNKDKLEKLTKQNAKLKSKNKKLEKQLDNIKFYIEQSNIKDMLWGKEILEIIGENND